MSTPDNLVMDESAGSDSSGTPGIKASKSYKVGDVIIAEKHFVHVVNHKFKGKNCDNCVKRV
jgi:hypothetical protein